MSNYQYVNKKTKTDNSFILNERMFVKIVDNGYVLPYRDFVKYKAGGVTDENHIFVKESGFVCGHNFWLNIENSYLFDESDVDYSYENDYALFLGNMWEHWGHFLNDIIVRLWYATEHNVNDLKLVYSIVNDKDVISENFIRVFELLGFKRENIINIKTPKKFKKIIIPSPSHISKTHKHSEEYNKIFQLIDANHISDSTKTFDKIYLSRRQLSKNEFGENIIENNFNKNGFVSIHMEKLTVDQQIDLIKNAKEIACVNSTLCLNCVFSNPDTKWIVLNKYRSEHTNFIEFCSMIKINPVFIDSYNQNLDYFGDKIGSFPYLLIFNNNVKRYFIDNHYNYSVYYLSRIYSIVCYLYHSFCFYIMDCIKRSAKKNINKT